MSDDSETIEIEREELEEYVGYLRIAHDLLQNARARLDQGERGIRELLDESDGEDDDENGGSAVTGYRGP